MIALYVSVREGLYPAGEAGRRGPGSEALDLLCQEPAALVHGIEFATEFSPGAGDLFGGADEGEAQVLGDRCDGLERAFPDLSVDGFGIVQAPFCLRQVEVPVCLSSP
ncbi:hypothetical protein [Streptomyces sp. NPDC045714]|uniref:hypothetical protein n=1 Tax=Streptomyces sp. NPDC045714 TaxID=3154913 RepID=UPI0033FC4C89